MKRLTDPDHKAQSPPYLPRMARNDPSSAAARWRLCFVVGLDQLLRSIFQNWQTLRPRRTVAATEKDQRHFETTTPKAMLSSLQRRFHCLDDYNCLVT